MFFFIGGITPRIKKLEDQPHPCPACGRSTFYHVRIIHYLNLFFIPVAPVKKGPSFYLCENCGFESPEPTMPSDFYADEISSSWQNSSRSQVCPGCGRLSDREFNYCPYCGHPLK